FAQPSRAPDMQHHTLYYPDPTFPYAYGAQTDSLSGRRDGILRDCLETNTCPKVFHVATSNEYWLYKNSQVTTDTLGIRDAPLPENVRSYLLAGLSHAPYPVNAPGVTEQPPNEMRYTYLLRALLTRLNAWTTSGAVPPPSRIPTISDRTLVRANEVTWPKI